MNFIMVINVKMQTIVAFISVIITTSENFENHKIYVKLKNMQIEMINNNTILKTWYHNFTRPAGVHYNHS